MRKWKTRIEAAKKRKCFTQTDHADAMGWDSCAVGEFRKQKGLFVDRGLLSKEVGMGLLLKEDRKYRLGMDFCEAVAKDDPEEAARIYKEIEVLYNGLD